MLEYLQTTPIDDPIAALETLERSDERQRSPLARFQKPLLVIAKVLSSPGTEFPTTLIEEVEGWISGRAESNIRDFINVFTEEIKYCTAKIQKLLIENERQKKFIAEELPAYFIALRKRNHSPSTGMVCRNTVGSQGTPVSTLVASPKLCANAVLSDP